MRITHRILITALIPFVAFTTSISLYLNQQWSEAKISAELKQKTQVFVATSNLINQIQRERGLTSTYLAGGSTYSLVKAAIDETDPLLHSFDQAIRQDNADLRTPPELHRFVDQIQQLRAFCQIPQSSVEKCTANYSSSVAQLLNLQSLIANSKTTAGVGKTYTS